MFAMTLLAFMAKNVHILGGYTFTGVLVVGFGMLRKLEPRLTVFQKTVRK